MAVSFAMASFPEGATGQSLSVTGMQTGPDGRASTVLTLGNRTGRYTVTASSTGLSGSPITFTAEAIALTSAEHIAAIPTEFELYQNYPNPFNPSTKIRFGLPEESKVSLEVYNMLGVVVARLVNEKLRAGYHEIVWQANDFLSGAYVLQMKAEFITSTRKFSSSKRIVLLK